MLGLSYRRYAKMLQDGLRSAWAELKAQHPTETVYAFGLYTDEDLLTFCSIAMTEETLTKLAKGDESSRADYRWSMGDSPFIDGFGNEALGRSYDWAMKNLRGPWHCTNAAKARRLKAIMASIRALDAEGIFGATEDRERLIVGVFGCDESSKGMIEAARKTNPPAAVRWLIETLNLPKPRGVVHRLGEGRYSVRDVSAARDFVLVAGRPSLLFTRDANRRLQPRRRWRGPAGTSCAIAPDGTTAYLGQDNGIVRFALTGWWPKPELVIETVSSAVALAVSPCGRHLAAEIFEGDLLVLDVSGEVRFRRARERVTSGHTRLAWHSDGARLAITDGAYVRLLDAMTGAEQWSQPTEIRAHAITIDPTGRWMAFARGVQFGGAPAPLQVGLFDLERPDAPPRLSAELGKSEASQIAFSLDGSQLAMACGARVRIFGLDLVERVQPRRADQEDFCGLAWLDDDQIAAVGRDVDEGPALAVFSATAEP